MTNDINQNIFISIRIRLISKQQQLSLQFNRCNFDKQLSFLLPIRHELRDFVEPFVWLLYAISKMLLINIYLKLMQSRPLMKAVCRIFSQPCRLYLFRFTTVSKIHNIDFRYCSIDFLFIIFRKQQQVIYRMKLQYLKLYLAYKSYFLRLRQ